MIISAIPWYWVLIWAVFATGFYWFRYRKSETMKNPWLVGAIFAVNFFLFAYAVVLFFIIEFIRYQRKKKTPKK